MNALMLDMKTLTKNTTVVVGYVKYDETEIFYGTVENVVPASVGHDARLTLHVGTDANGKKQYRSFLESRITYLNHCLTTTSLDGKLAFHVG